MKIYKRKYIEHHQTRFSVNALDDDELMQNLKKRRKPKKTKPDPHYGLLVVDPHRSDEL